jgi:recombination protein U
MAKISKYNSEGYKDPTPYEALKNVKNPKRQMQGAQARAVGQHFENMIDAACRYYEDRQLAVIEKTPEPMRPIKSLGGGKFVAHYEKQAQPDYKGTLVTGRAVVFEAKHTSATKIEQSRLSIEQSDRLQKHSELGAVTFVLVSIDLQSFYRVPWDIWKDMKKLFGHKHMTIEELEPYKVKAAGGTIKFLEGVQA